MIFGGFRWGHGKSLPPARFTTYSVRVIIQMTDNNIMWVGTQLPTNLVVVVRTIYYIHFPRRSTVDRGNSGGLRTGEITKMFEFPNYR